MMLQTASAIPLPVRPPQLQNMHSRVNQAQPGKLLPAAPVVQPHPCHPTVVNQNPTLCQPRLNSTQQPEPKLTTMNRQDLRVEQRQSYQTQNGQHPNVAIVQNTQCGGQSNQQFGNPHLAEGVDWREDMFQKITSLKDAHLSELVGFARYLHSCVHQMKTNGQLESLSKEQVAQCRYAHHTMERIKQLVNFLQTQKTKIPEGAKDQLDTWQTAIQDLLTSYKAIKARTAAKNAQRHQAQNCGEPPQVVNTSGATDDNGQQNHHEQHAAEALSHSSQDAPSETPLTQQESHSDNLTDEAEDNTVRDEAESPVAVSAFTGGTCSQQIQQQNPADEAIPQLTQTVEPAVASPAQQQTHRAHTARVEAEDDLALAEAESPVDMEALIKRGVDAGRSLSPAALRSLASDMGVNLKRAFRHTTSDTMDSSSCVRFDEESSGKSGYKRQKTCYGTLLEEIRATYNMLVETEIRISEEDTGGADGTVIELCYNAVSLTVDLSAAICASEITTKLLVPADYPQSSPMILGGDGERRNGVPGVVDMAFRRALGLLPEPRSIEAMAKAWDSIVRRSVVQFAHRFGGGMFSTRYGRRESCIPV
ncbi:hypothetical protein ACQ4PT_067346 [Festuca glaucescens]